MSKFIIFLMIFLSCNAFAKPAGGGGSSGVKDACEISGGTFTGAEGGNWACCWSNWGCYGCYNGNCGMTCRTEKCRKANAARVSGVGERVKGLAPAKMQAPYAPAYSNKPIQQAPKMNKLSN